jgi:hypothetical protein
MPHIFAAEGSDWFWWYGSDFSSPLDAQFDALFRLHLTAAYRAAGLAPPDELQHPIKRASAQAAFRPPSGRIEITVDGSSSHYFEWLSAGSYAAASEIGAFPGSTSLVAEVRFGCGRRNLYLRLDPPERTQAPQAYRDCLLRLSLLEPRRMTVDILNGPEHAALAIGQILEWSCPLEDLGIAPGDEVVFYIEVGPRGQLIHRYPALCDFVFTCPTEEMTRQDWSA